MTPVSNPHILNPAQTRDDRLDHSVGRQDGIDANVSEISANKSIETTRHAKNYPKNTPASPVDGLGTIAGDGSYVPDPECGSGNYFGNSSTVNFVTQVQRILAFAEDRNQTSVDTLDSKAAPLSSVIV